MRISLTLLNGILAKIGLVLVVEYPSRGTYEPICLELTTWNGYYKRIVKEQQELRQQYTTQG